MITKEEVLANGYELLPKGGCMLILRSCQETGMI